MFNGVKELFDTASFLNPFMNGSICKTYQCKSYQLKKTQLNSIGD